MNEKQSLISTYYLMQVVPFIFLALEFMCYVHFSFSSLFSTIIPVLSRAWFFTNILHNRLFVLGMIVLASLGTTAKKDIEFSAIKQVIIPVVIGLVFFGSSVFIFANRTIRDVTDIYNLLYIILSVMGSLLILVGLNNISKYLKNNFLKDRYNKENESFKQTEEKVETPYSVNIPMQYYWEGKYHKGWINIVNPFRGTLLIGTPGSGKSFSVVNSFIRQHSAKGFSLVVYDFKFPDLAQLSYYHFLKNKQKGVVPPNTQFHVINFTDIEYSRRINPLKPDYIRTLADATETSEALIESLQRGVSAQGNADFFKTSAVNFLAACIYFFSKYKKGKYSDLPHVLAFINSSYEDIFNVLFTNSELISLLSPFKSAFDKKAFDQLEGQIGTVKVQISRLATKESFWVFTGDDFNLKVSDKEHPAYLVIANDPKTQSMNSALNALIINRLTRLVNTKGNNPVSIIIDETPTLYFHQVSNLLSTARSNKVSVLLGLQEIPQLEELYGKANAKTITSVIGNVLSGSVRSKESLDWLQTLFGKVKQRKENISVTRTDTNISYNEQMDYVIPASKISTLPTGSLVGQVVIDFGQEDKFETTNYNCATKLDMDAIKQEEKNFPKMPKFYNFGGDDKKEEFLMKNLKKIYNDIDEIIKDVFRQTTDETD